MKTPKPIKCANCKTKVRHTSQIADAHGVRITYVCKSCGLRRITEKAAPAPAALNDISTR